MGEKGRGEAILLRGRLEEKFKECGNEREFGALPCLKGLLK